MNNVTEEHLVPSIRRQRWSEWQGSFIANEWWLGGYALRKNINAAGYGDLPNDSVIASHFCAAICIESVIASFCCVAICIESVIASFCCVAICFFLCRWSNCRLPRPSRSGKLALSPESGLAVTDPPVIASLFRVSICFWIVIIGDLRSVRRPDSSVESGLGLLLSYCRIEKRNPAYNLDVGVSPRTVNWCKRSGAVLFRPTGSSHNKLPWFVNRISPLITRAESA